jgi:hypothetical protein
MKKELSAKDVTGSIKINRYGYGIFLLLVIYQLVNRDIENATINLGIALIFDPFDLNVTWKDRPLYQRIWLLVHVALTISGFLYLVFN